MAGLDRNSACGQPPDHVECRRDLTGSPQCLPQDLDGLLHRGLSQDPGDRQVTLPSPPELLGCPVGIGADIQVVPSIRHAADAPLADQGEKRVVHPHTKQV